MQWNLVLLQKSTHFYKNHCFLAAGLKFVMIFLRIKTKKMTFWQFLPVYSVREPQYFFLEKLNLKRSQNDLYALKGLIFTGINFRGTFFHDFAKNHENKFLEIAHFWKYILQKIVKVILKLENLEKYTKISNSFASREN